MRVGVLGIGGLGAAIVDRELECGLEMTIFDPRPEATAPFADRASVASSAAGVAAACDVVQLVVNDDAQVLAALHGADGVLAGAAPGLVVLVHSTISHDTLRPAVAKAAEQRVHVLDAPVSGARGHMSIPDMCVMVGGDEHAFAVAEPVLRTFASLVLHLGASGAGLDAKLARNAIGYLFYVINLEGLRLTDAAGIPRETMWQILDHTGLQGTRGGMSGVPMLTPDEGPPWSSETARHMTAVAQKDLRAALARAEQLGIPMPTTITAIDRMADMFGVPASRV